MSFALQATQSRGGELIGDGDSRDYGPGPDMSSLPFPAAPYAQHGTTDFVTQLLPMLRGGAHMTRTNIAIIGAVAPHTPALSSRTRIYLLDLGTNCFASQTGPSFVAMLATQFALVRASFPHILCVACTCPTRGLTGSTYEFNRATASSLLLAGASTADCVVPFHTTIDTTIAADFPDATHPSVSGAAKMAVQAALSINTFL